MKVTRSKISLGTQIGKTRDSRRLKYSDAESYLIVTWFFCFCFCLEANGIDVEVIYRDVTVEEMGVEKTWKEKNVE